MISTGLNRPGLACGLDTPRIGRYISIRTAGVITRPGPSGVVDPQAATPGDPPTAT